MALGIATAVVAAWALPDQVNPLVRFGVIEGRDSADARIRRATAVAAIVDKNAFTTAVVALPPLSATSSVAAPLPRPNISAADLTCLAKAIHHEAKGDNIEAQIAIAQIALNRGAQSGQSMCQVIAATIPREGCVFAATCAAKVQPALDSQPWLQAMWIAEEAAAGRAGLRELEHADRFHHYLAIVGRPQNMQRVRRIGPNVFYAPLDTKPDLRMVRQTSYRWDREDEGPVALWAPSVEGQHQILSAIDTAQPKTQAARPIVIQRTGPANKSATPSFDARAAFPSNDR